MKSQLKKWILKVISLLVLIVLYFISATKFKFYIPCVFHHVTNLYCPGCGMGRALLAILRFDFVQAFCYNPFIYVFLGIVIYSLGGELIYIINKKDNQVKYPQKVMIILLVFLLLFGLFRNIPGFEFLLPQSIH